MAEQINKTNSRNILKVKIKAKFKKPIQTENQLKKAKK